MVGPASTTTTTTTTPPPPPPPPPTTTTTTTTTKETKKKFHMLFPLERVRFVFKNKYKSARDGGGGSSSRAL
jgi:hypothetical protein